MIALEKVGISVYLNIGVLIIFQQMNLWRNCVLPFTGCVLNGTSKFNFQHYIVIVVS